MIGASIGERANVQSATVSIPPTVILFGMPFIVAPGARHPPKMFAAKHIAPVLRAGAASAARPVAGASRNVATRAASSSKEDVVTLKDLAERGSEATGIVKKDVEAIIRSVVSEIEKTVAGGGKVQLTGALRGFRTIAETLPSCGVF